MGNRCYRIPYLKVKKNGLEEKMELKTHSDNIIYLFQF